MTETTETLVIVCGLPGVGKTTVSGHVADHLDAERIRTDVVRKELFEDPTYTDAEVRRVYEEVFRRGRTALEETGVVVLDGTFKRRALRERAQSVARTVGTDFRAVKVECAEPVVRDRIEGREGDESDADVSVHEQFRGSFEPLSMDHETVDNSGDAARTRRRVAELL